MSEQETVYDSPSQWVADHIRDYVETGGEKGHDWRGAPTLLLTTRGRKTGRLRRTALIYGRMGDAYVVVASKGGAPQHPMWYLNLKANPDVQVQVGPDVFEAVARDATDDERPFLWEQMVSIWPAYDDYQEKTTRRIPLVVIEPTTGAE
ncbi:MAG: nitroreductase family deazaflavin-dependent oxidoreductase [Acidimicrobiales bacterium]|jgi:deazaflavin-dependent oxidoreductase (nitroreductase family)|nr:nitroreductase family deazaflavin-dependent oxidoreductase [Acidimicrobiales bacterium]HLV90734.1 nitroreductase family deazaflavin-dependent oxidoreductase [Acidimicrobiia bacterium]